MMVTPDHVSLKLTPLSYFFLGKNYKQEGYVTTAIYVHVYIQSLFREQYNY